jgi:hypothetical protein
MTNSIRPFCATSVKHIPLISAKLRNLLENQATCTGFSVAENSLRKPSHNSKSHFCCVDE